MRFLSVVFLSVLLFGCGEKFYPAKVVLANIASDTSKVTLTPPVQRDYDFEHLHFSSDFKGGGMSKMQRLQDSIFVLTIYPEHERTLAAPRYALKCWTDSLVKPLTLNLKTTDAADFQNSPLKSYNTAYWLSDAATATGQVPLKVSADTLWLANQPLQNTSLLRKWMDMWALHPAVSTRQYGTSVQGKPLYLLDIHEGVSEGLPLVVIAAFQNPQEYAGYISMKNIVKEIMSEGPAARDFRRHYRTLIFPMMNPDAVDKGHWLLNSNGVELAQDWVYYSQPEVKSAADFIVNTATQNDTRVALGISFAQSDTSSFLALRSDHLLKNLESILPAKKDNTLQPDFTTWVYRYYNTTGMKVHFQNHFDKHELESIGTSIGVWLLNYFEL